MRRGFVALVLLGALGCTPSVLREDAPASYADAQPAGPDGRSYRPERPHLDVFAHNYTWPTGVFDPRWVLAAQAADAAMPQGLPRGRMPPVSALKGLKNTAFIPMGPLPLLGAVPTGGRVNAIVVSPQPYVAGDPNSHRAWAATDGAGVWVADRCCNEQTTWRVTTDQADIASSSIGDLTLDPNNPQVVYAGTGDLRFGSYSFGSAGLLKSTDGGETWRVLGAEVFNAVYPIAPDTYPQYQAIGKVVVNPADSDQLAVGTKTGLFFSGDAGEHWTGPCFTSPHLSQRQDITGLLAQRLADRTRLVVAVGTRGNATPVQPDLDRNGANGIYTGTWPQAGCPTDFSLSSRPDNGWMERLGDGTEMGPVGRIELAEAPGVPEVLYAEAIHPRTFRVIGVWRSANGGQSWQAAAAEADFLGCDGPGTQNWYNAGLSVAPGTTDTVFLSAWDVFRSTNGGISFTNLTCTRTRPEVHIDQHARAFVGGDPNRLLIGNDGGIYYSANALATTPVFASINDSLNTIEFYAGDLSAHFLGSEQRQMVGGAQDNGTSVLVQGGPARAEPWRRVQGGDGVTARIEPVRAQRWYYSFQWGDIRVSTNGPNQAEQQASGNWSPGQGTIERKSFLMPFDLYRYGRIDVPDSGCTDTGGCTHLIAGTFRVWESTNGAVAATADARWRVISPDLTRDSLVVGTDNRSFINDLAYAWSDRRVAIVGTNDAKVWYGFGLGSAGASTARWVDLTDGNQVLPMRPVMNVTTDPANPLIGYAAIGGFSANTPARPGHVFQVRCSADCATYTWRDVSGNLPDIPVNALMVNPNVPGQVYAGTDWGLYYTDDVHAERPRWFRFEGLPRVMVWDLQIDRGYTTLAAFTRARGAWVWPLPQAAIGGNEAANLTGIWAGVGQPGWGMSISQQGQTLIPIWYTYDGAGRPAWLLVSGAREQSDGSYVGPLFRFNGTPFNQINGQPANAPGTEVGQARFRRQGDGRLELTYQVDGVTQQRLLEPLALGPPAPTCREVFGDRSDATNHSDLWWNPTESGWGMHLAEAGEVLFLTWYTYAADGAPMWVTGQLQRQADARFVGPLNRPTAGTPLLQINGPATAFPVPEVGTAEVRFSSGVAGSFSYTLDGISQTRSIQRAELAGPGYPRCEP